jgi:hypothetical protein
VETIVVPSFEFQAVRHDFKISLEQLQALEQELPLPEIKFI